MNNIPIEDLNNNLSSSIDEYLNNNDRNNINNEIIASTIHDSEALMILIQMMEDEEDLSLNNNNKQKWGGSRPGKAPNKERDFDMAYNKLVKDYFSGDESVYSEVDFETRFRVSRVVFNTLYNEVYGVDPFIQKYDAVGKKGIHPLVRFTACFRMIAYGDSFDREDENFRLSGSALRPSFKSFCKIIYNKFSDKYLNRTPNKLERESILKVNAKRGFPGLLASWDCSHFEWHKCPIQLHGQFKNGRYKGKTIVLEAVVDCYLRIWYAHFGFPGTLNDINILGKSNIVFDILDGKFDLKTDPYIINGYERDYLYFLVDGIYPPWSIFINSYDHSTTDKQKYFAKQQEAVRKDVERVFAVLSTKFQILSRPFRLWELSDINEVMVACVIIHNIQVEFRINEIGEDAQIDENNLHYEKQLNNNDDNVVGDVFLFDHVYDTNIKNYLDRRIAYMNSNVRDEKKHHELKRDLTEHIFDNKERIYMYNNRKNK